MGDRPGRGRWALGLSLLLGALGTLALFPRAGSTAAGQVVVALGGRPEWLQAAFGGPRPRLEGLLATPPEDVELQIGAATLPPVKAEDAELDPEAPLRQPDDAQEVLTRLYAVARRFPNEAAVRAHRLRHMARSAVWLERPEETQLDGPQARAAARAPRKRPPTEALRMFALTAGAGRRLEPENGFFDAMRAAGAFAAGRDEEALRLLHVAASKPEWNDHAVEETRARWKLLQAAYGDHGALQKLPVASALLLPHFAPMRAVARMARWHAARRERAGDDAGAHAIRWDVMRLGARMTDGSPLLIGKLVGIAIFKIGASPVPAGPVRPPPGSPAAWEAVWRARRERYAARLASSGAPAEAAWVRAQGERLDATRVRINRVVQAEGFMGLLRRLQAGWVFGVVLLKQIGVLLLLWAAALLLARAAAVEGEEGHPTGREWLVVYLVLFLTPVLLLASYGSIPLALVGQGIGLALVGVVALARWIGRRQARRGREGDDRGRSEEGWQLGLVGLVAILPSTALLALACAAVRRGLGGTEVMFPFRELYGMIGTQTPSPVDLAVPALVLLPAALLPFGVLCYAAARELPLTAGLARGVRRGAPYAIVLLALVYLASLAPTVAADRALERHVEQMVTDELGS